MPRNCSKRFLLKNYLPKATERLTFLVDCSGRTLIAYCHCLAVGEMKSWTRVSGSLLMYRQIKGQFKRAFHV